MNSKTLALTITATVGTALALTILVGEGLNYNYNNTLDPRAPFLRSKLTSLKDDKGDLQNEEVNKFYKNNGEGFLIATPVDGKTTEFTFKYYPVSQKFKALEAAQKVGSLKNWSAVSKFLEINKATNSKPVEENQTANDDFMEYVGKHWDDPTVKKILEGKNVKLQYIDLNCAAIYTEQALFNKKIKPEELNSLLNDMPQSCVDYAVYLIMGNYPNFAEDISVIAKNPEFDALNKDFKSNIGAHLDDPFLKKISPTLPGYIHNLNIKQFGFRLLISKKLDIVTDDETLAFMSKVIPNFEKRMDKIMSAELRWQF